MKLAIVRPFRRLNHACLIIVKKRDHTVMEHIAERQLDTVSNYTIITNY
jgi:hypothetical protein